MSDNQKYMNKENEKENMRTKIEDYIAAALEAGFDYGYIEREIVDMIDEASDGRIKIK